MLIGRIVNELDSSMRTINCFGALSKCFLMILLSLNKRFHPLQVDRSCFTDEAGTRQMEVPTSSS